MGVEFDDEAGIAAIVRAREAGFRFTHVRSADEVIAIHAERRRDGAVDTFTVRGPQEAYAARVRPEDTTAATPLWQRFGEPADVIDELLDLPAPGTPGAPAHPLRGPGDDLEGPWLPGLP